MTMSAETIGTEESDSVVVSLEEDDDDEDDDDEGNVPKKYPELLMTGPIHQYAGETWQIPFRAGTKYKAKFTSSNPSVATVDSNGLITCIAPGNTKITLTAHKEYIDGFGLLVLEPGQDLKDDPLIFYDDGLTIKMNKRVPYKLQFDVPLDLLSSVNFKSSKTKVATVGQFGELWTKKKGKTVINFYVNDEAVGQCRVVVK